jgi:hypothetical protein
MDWAWGLARVGSIMWGKSGKAGRGLLSELGEEGGGSSRESEWDLLWGQKSQSLGVVLGQGYFE